ncbi:MAG TPA: NAD(P)-dependent oxidoreductase, partial [Diaminobutyricibacter sp.]
LARAGATVASLDDFGQCDVVLVVLPGPREVADVGPKLLDRMRSGSSLVVMSTTSRETIAALNDLATKRGVAIIDAPMTGAADGASAGALTIMVGAEAADLETVRPVLTAISERIYLVGPLGCGTAIKLLTNMLWFIHVVALCDALAFGVKSGIPANVVAEVIPNTAGASWVAEHDLQNIIGSDEDRSFNLALCVKDLGLIASLAEEIQVPIPFASLAAERFERARREFGDDAGELAVGRLTEAAAGISIRSGGDAS